MADGNSLIFYHANMCNLSEFESQEESFVCKSVNLDPFNCKRKTTDFRHTYIDIVTIIHTCHHFHTRIHQVQQREKKKPNKTKKSFESKSKYKTIWENYLLK